MHTLTCNIHMEQNSGLTEKKTRSLGKFFGCSISFYFYLFVKIIYYVFSSTNKQDVKLELCF